MQGTDIRDLGNDKRSTLDFLIENNRDRDYGPNHRARKAFSAPAASLDAATAAIDVDQ